MAAQGGGGGEGAQDSLAILWIVGAIFIALALVWHFWAYELKVLFLKIRFYEAIFISYFTASGAELAIQLQETNPYTLDLAQAQFLSQAVGNYLRYPASLLLGLLFILLYSTHANLQFSKRYDMKRLAQQEQVNWPQITPVVRLDLAKEDIKKGPWAMAMNPMEFARHYKLITVEMVPDKKSPWKAQGTYKAIVDKEKAYRLFVSQLGPLWAGIDKLPIHTQALFAALAARVEHDTAGATNLLKHLSATAGRGKPDYTGVTKLLNQHLRAKAVQTCVSRHAYVYTVMAGMLELARTDGVFAVADFLWLKPIDRRLWYVLDCVGRRVAFSEVAGPFAHFLAEKEMGRSLNVPVVDEAVRALELAMEQTIYVPVDGEDIPLVGEQNG